ncbi:hypothetical protein [Kribbella kalugense]|uniref:hypothetical protein n=1 Tax=Kribbella kalugense TaxID=2512221 RepID=UPI0010650DD2|nr:hypothetical protein [Kribbella kalugense]
MPAPTTGSPIAVVGLVALVVAIELQVRIIEEPHLIKLHGATYLDYSTRVGRFLPGIGRLNEQTIGP